MKVGRVNRIVRILTALQGSRSYSADELAEMFATSKRTVFRDLKELESIGVPHHYDSQSGGYRIDSEYFMAPVDLSVREALSLLLLFHKAAAKMELPFRDSAVHAALKIESNLPVNIKNYCDLGLRNVTVKGFAKATVKLLDEVFSKLQKAITEKRKVQMRYNSLFDHKVIETELHPMHLMYNKRAWYVIGFSVIHESIRIFKLKRILDIELLNKLFIEEDDFDINDYLGRAWAMIPEGRIYNVKLRFLPKVAENVSEVLWHSTQKISRTEDGSAIAEFRVDGLGEIMWWILGYGDQVEVIEPKVLRQKIIKAAKRLIELNGGA